MLTPIFPYGNLTKKAWDLFERLSVQIQQDSDSGKYISAPWSIKF